MSRRSSGALYGGGQRSLDAFSRNAGFGLTGVEIVDPFDTEKKIKPAEDTAKFAELQFANRFGLSAYAGAANNLATALSNPATQLKEVNSRIGDIVGRLTKLYENYVATLRQVYLPEDEIYAKANAYITPLLAAEMDVLRMQYPFAIGGLGGGQFTPLAGIASARGDASGFAGARQFDNWRSLKKAFKKQKKDRKRRKSS